MMKPLLLLNTLITLAIAVPGGYYYQESSSRSSSSSFKNNELQHQTEDESFYSRRGDSESRTQPKVNTYSQHLQYQNPNNRNNGHSTNLGSHSQAFGNADDSDTYAARQAVGSDGIVRTVSGNRDHYTYTATYGVSGGETQLRGGQYDTQSNLLTLTQGVQNDLSRKLNNAVTQQRTYDAHSGNTYVETNFRNLERELRANLSRQLQEELQRQYGTQMSRGSHSYTIQNGHYSPQANYNTQELQDLTSQLETNLLQQLRNQYQNTQSSSSSSSSSNYYSSSQQTNNQQTEQGSRGHSSMYSPTYDSFPLHPEVRPSIPLTDVLSQVQNTVDRRLNDALSRVEQQYLTHNVYSEVPNYDVILENLKEELKQNISTILQTTLVEQYGTQEEHHNYYYSSRNIASGSKVANYNTNDLNSLKQQVENNLTQKLKNSIQLQRQSYQTTRQTYSHSQTYNSNYNTGYTNNKASSPEIYTSYVVFTPSRRQDSVYPQTNTQNSDNTYDNGQTNTRPEYRPIYTSTNTQRPIRYGTYQPSSQNTNYGTNTYQTSSQNQDSQRVEQLEYDYSPTGSHSLSGTGPTQTSQTTSRGTHYPSSSGPSGTVYYPSQTQSVHLNSNTRYPSNSGTSYTSVGGDTNSQTNFQTYQQNSESSHKITTGQRESGIEYTPSLTRPQQPEYQAELINIRDQVQNDLSRQVNTAIEKQRQSSSSYSSSSVASSQVLAELSEELKRNLTQKIEKALNEHYGRTGVRGGYTFTVSSGGRINPGNYNREQLTTLTNQLQEDLLRQLREGLAQQSYRQSNSYSSNYEPVISQGTYDHGSNSYRTYSSGSSYSYSSGGGHGECCMQADDSTTIADEKTNQVPERGDIGIEVENKKKLEDINSESDTTQQNTDDIQTQDHIIDIEVVPSEDVEITTQKLARDKSSTKKPLSVENKRQEENPQEGRSTNHATRVTQDLLNFERHQNAVDYQQQIQQVHQPQSIDQQINQNANFYDQQIGQSHFDQGTIDEYDQFVDGDQETDGQLLEQHATGNVQETRRIMQSTIRDLSTNNNRQSDSSFRRYLNTQRSQDTQNLHNEQELTQKIEDLTQQTEDLSQQTEDLSQQTEDLSQQTEDLTQQTEDLNHQPEDLTQQAKDLNQQIEDLNQQAEELNQESQDLNQETTDLHQQTEDLNQQTENLNIQTEDLHQRTEQLNKKNEDLNQKTEDLNQETENPNQRIQNLNQQTENLNQQMVYIRQQTENFDQQTGNLNKQIGDSGQATENLHQQKTDDISQHFEQQNFDQQQSRFSSSEQRNIPLVYLEHQASGESQNNASEQRQHISQQIQDMNQNGESLYHHYRGSYGPHHSHSTFHSYNSQSSRSSSSYSSSENRQIHYGNVNHVPLEKTNNLEQQHPEVQNANVVQDVSHQVVLPFSSTSNTNELKLEDTIEVTTEKPGFWKRLGGKISHTYHKAKDSITSIG